ncbi:MAPEG family protein [Dyella japonica]|jgi:uncharacterized MAPEG superfamily protein|uniref:Membrane protein n=1 Tax=Dyella japonica DSM 16301 TaxID=1440762 RepID=A0A0G9H4X2_9GAMM|nr:MAPEG family protein [Dyella japonica]KLD64546.1 membrane protein [Dyella japonica DSM 16301]
MPVELKMLAWSIVLGLVYVVVAVTLATMQRGLAWSASNRTGEAPLTGAADRTSRACRNFLETFAFFAAAVLVVVVGQRTTGTTALGAQIYFWARVIYLPVFAAGIPYLRTLIWAGSVVGLVMILSGVFGSN